MLIRVASYGFLAAVGLSLAVCAAGPVAVWLRADGAWLFGWPLAFLFARFAGLYVLPPVGVALACVATVWERGAFHRRILPFANLGVCVLLVVAIIVVQRHSRVSAQREFAQRFPGLQPADVLAGPVGRPMPDVPVRSLDGRIIDLGGLVRTNRVSAIVFWASYDQGWAGSIALASSISADFGKDGVGVFCVNEQETPEAVQSFLTARRVTLPVFLDPDGRCFARFGLFGSVEQFVLVSSNGVVLAHFPGGDEEEVRLRRTLRDL